MTLVFRLWKRSRASRYLPALALLVLLVPACSQGQSGSHFDKAALEAYLRHQQALGPQVTVEISEPRPSPIPSLQEVKVRLSAGNASQEETVYVSADGKQLLRGRLFDMTVDPFAANREKLKLDGSPATGSPRAPVTLVVFSDFQCAFCSQEARTLRENLPKAFPTEVRLHFKDMPLDAIHPWARAAAIAGRCVLRQNEAKFWDYHDWIFARQQEITPENFRAKFLDFSGSIGLETLQLTSCLDNRTTEPEVEQSIAEARQLGVNSTPTLFINGRMLAGAVPWQYLQQVIEYELSKPQSAKADPSCCSVEIPLPGGQRPQ